ncbi:MAG: DUF1203 domain-containing protein [Ancalomicrobiaceae bacterium]|nr:DUF1203 domain-containing protein [Ancalomicrobiaceae bacterium]
MSFRIRGLDPAPFQPLFGLSDEDLSRHAARRYRVDRTPGVPDRIELRDLLPGETAILVNYLHQPANTPYRASHAIFVREGAEAAVEVADAIPEVLRSRTISLRAFSGDGEMLEADLAEGRDLAPLIERFFQIADVAYLHAHFAKRGCFAARIDRG